MSRRKSPGIAMWKIFSQAAMKQTRHARRAAGKVMTHSMLQQAKAVGEHSLSTFVGVMSPASAPVSRGSGRWLEGSWGLGPMMMRKFRLFVPQGVTSARPAPLLMLLHGCRQDSATFAAVTHIAAVARAERCIALLPEQSPQSNIQRCWNWFSTELGVAAEARLLLSMLAHVSRLVAVRQERVFVMGMSAGGSMAMALGLRFPQQFTAVASHSGAAPIGKGAASGTSHPATVDTLRKSLAGQQLPPLLILHGDVDRLVPFENAMAAAVLWLDLLPDHPPSASISRQVQRGRRRAYIVSEWQIARQAYVRLLRIEGLAHAWSGGGAKRAFSDATGPDALKLAFRFFAECPDRANRPV